MEKSKEYYEREPDLETESFRMWKMSDEEKETLKSKKEIESENDIKIKIGDFELNMCGFNQIMNKEKKLIFAYKIKHRDNSFLYYIPDDDTEEERKNCEEFISSVEKVNEFFEYELIDMKKHIENLKNEKHLIDKVERKNAPKK